MTSQQVVQHWIDEGYVIEEGDNLLITTKGSLNPAVALVFDSNYSKILDSLYEAGLIEYVFDETAGIPTYKVTKMGLEWADILKDMT